MWSLSTTVRSAFSTQTVINAYHLTIEFIVCESIGELLANAEEVWPFHVVERLVRAMRVGMADRQNEEENKHSSETILDQTHRDVVVVVK